MAVSARSVRVRARARARCACKGVGALTCMLAAELSALELIIVLLSSSFERVASVRSARGLRGVRLRAATGRRAGWAGSAPKRRAAAWNVARRVVGAGITWDTLKGGLCLRLTRPRGAEG